MFGSKKTQKPRRSPPDTQDKRELVAMNINLDKLTAEIEGFLTRSDDPFDFNTYTIHKLQDRKLTVFEIDYGYSPPPTKLLLVLDGDSYHLRILNYLPDHTRDYVIAQLVSAANMARVINSEGFNNRLWQFLEKAVRSPETLV